VLRQGALNQFDPAFDSEMGLQTRTWDLFIQSPLAQYLPPKLVWGVHQAYYYPDRTVRRLRHRVAATMVMSPQAWLDLAQEFLPEFESELTLVEKTVGSFDEALKAM
jgi:hypothetical protein